MALAKRDDMLASMRQQEQGGRIPAPLLFADGDIHAGVTSQQLLQLRQKSESPHELCDIAALALVSERRRPQLTFCCRRNLLVRPGGELLVRLCQWERRP